jgi:hypothetical protein
MDAATHQIVARLRQRLRGFLRGSPGWTAEFRKAKRARRPTIWAILGATLGVATLIPLMGFICPLACIRVLADMGGIDLLLGLVGLAATAGSLLLVNALKSALGQSRTLSVFSHLPVDDERIARRLWWGVPALGCVGLWFTGLAYGFVAWSEGFDTAGWMVALGLAAVQWAAAVALATVLLLSRPRWRYGELAIALFALTGALIAALAVNPGVIRAPVVAELLYRLLPAGWISGALGKGFIGGRLEAWWGLAPIGLLIATTPATLRRLAALYEVREFSFRPDAEAQATITGWLGPPETPADEEMDQPTSIEERLDGLLAGRERIAPVPDVIERIRRREFLAEFNWPAEGMIERVAANLLSDRERAIIGFLTAGRPRWTQSWAHMLVALPIGIVIGLLGVVGPWIVVHLLAWAAVTAVAVGPWRGCQWRACGGTFLPHSAIMPIEYREAAKAIFKTGIVRCLFALPILLIGSLYLAGPAGVRLEAAALGAIGFTGLLVVCLPLVSMTVLSAGLRFPTMNRWTWMLVIVPVALLIVGLAGVGMVIAWFTGGAGWRFGVAGLGLVAGGSLGLSSFFSVLHRRGRVDLVTSRLSSIEQKAIANYEKAERARLRADILREHYGVLWWLRRDLRRWAARTE